MVNKMNWDRFFAHQKAPMINEFQTILPQYLKILNSTVEENENANPLIQKRAFKIMDILQLNGIIVGEDGLQKNLTEVLKLVKAA